MKLLSEQVDEKEIAVILRELSKTKEISGDVVEFGCFVGTTSVFLAKEIEKWNAEKSLWLYDSFEGLPEKSREDENSLGEVFKKGELLATKKQLIANLRKSGARKMPKITKGWFSELSKEQIPRKISFAFLDGDYYESIKTSLALIAPKLTKNAVIIVDDYASEALPGAARAVDEWCRARQLQLRVEASLAIIRLA